MLDTCECDRGWGGPDCSSSLRQTGWLPQWLLYALMVSVLVVSFGAMAATYGFVEDWNTHRRQAAVDAAAALVRSPLRTECDTYKPLHRSACVVECANSACDALRWR
jgi:hypothetical protein